MVRFIRSRWRDCVEFELVAMNYSFDDQIAVVAACTTLGASGSSSSLGPNEWSRLALWLHSRGLRPADVLQLSSEQCVELSEEEPKIESKLQGIADRSASVSLEMEQLEHQGLWVRARFEDGYPENWRVRLKASAPPVAFGAGPLGLLGDESIAVVGSREISTDLFEVAVELGKAIAKSGCVMVSGGARGSDRAGMTGAIEYGGSVVGILSGDLDRFSRQQDLRRWIAEDQLCLVSHVQPKVGFSVGNAMARNKLIYALASATIVISTAEGSGGTWSGATENLKPKNRWSPLLVWTGEGAPEANQALVREGGYGFDAIPQDADEFASLVEEANYHWLSLEPDLKPVQQALLSDD